MNELLNAVTALVCVISPDKVASIANRIRHSSAFTVKDSIASVVGSSKVAQLVQNMLNSWDSSEATAGELASMLLAASHTLEKIEHDEKIELVWTGPTTSSVSTRQTEQALLQVINASKTEVFITSFVAYDISTIVSSLNAAVDRGVTVSMLLELSQSDGGSIDINVIGKMKTLVPSARLFAWREKSERFQNGRVHAKVAVADDQICFITSANLTGFAMERNMEAGVLIRGGQIPVMLKEHLQSLVNLKIIEQA